MKALDFNSLQQPTWDVTLRDEERTLVHVAVPTVELIDRLEAMVPTLQEVTKSKDGKTIKAVFGLVAELLNVNEDGYVFTAEELRDRYKLRLLDVLQFVAGYLEFVKEIKDAKN